MYLLAIIRYRRPLDEVLAHAEGMLAVAVAPAGLVVRVDVVDLQDHREPATGAEGELPQQGIPGGHTGWLHAGRRRLRHAVDLARRRAGERH